MKNANICSRHRFPPEIISHCVWLYYRFSLSYRDIELDGQTLDVLVQRKRNAKAALRFFKRLRKQGEAPRNIITDKTIELRTRIRPHVCFW